MHGLGPLAAVRFVELFSVWEDGHLLLMVKLKPDEGQTIFKAVYSVARCFMVPRVLKTTS